MEKSFSHFKIFVLGALVLCTFFACRKKYPYFFPDGTPGKGADSASITVDTAMSSIDYSKYPQARVFPGLVGDQVPRLKDYQVTLDLDYHYVGQTLRVSVPPLPEFSVGLYAPAGELIEITVPEGVHNLTLQIGAWTDNLSSKLNPPRDPVIVSRQKLAPGKNYIRNLYGGTIYILSPRPVSHPVTLSFTGAVKQPDFILGETDPVEWWKNLQDTDVPWLEMRSPNFVVVVPRSKFLQENLRDPSKALEFWNNAVLKDYYEWMGLSANPADPLDQAPFLPFRAVLDIGLSVGYGHNGFPVMFIDDNYWFNSVANYNAIKNLDTWGTFHEFGHNNQQGSVWSLSNLGETTNNLFIFHAAHRLNKQRKAEGKDTINFADLHEGLPQDFAEGLAYAAKGGSKHFVTDMDNPFTNLTPFLQIYQMARPAPGNGASGWDFMPFIYTRARHAKRLSANDQDRRDFIYEAVSEFTHQNWEFFFKAWGMQISDQSKGVIAGKGYPLMVQTVWTYNPGTDTGGIKIVDPYDSQNWSIVDFSSEETSGEGPVNGPAANIIDGDPNTYWAAQWSGDGSQPPQWITVDMGAKLAVQSFIITQRQVGTSRHLAKIKILVSDDNENWQSLGIFPLQDSNDPQTITLPGIMNFRYFQLYFGDTDYMITDNPFFDLGEVNVVAP